MHAICNLSFKLALFAAVIATATNSPAQDEPAGVKKPSRRQRPKVESVDGAKPADLKPQNDGAKTGDAEKTSDAKPAAKAAPAVTPKDAKKNEGSGEAPIVKLSKQAPVTAKSKPAPIISRADLDKPAKPIAEPSEDTESNPSAAAKAVGVYLRPSKQGDPPLDAAWTEVEPKESRPSSFQSLTPGKTTAAELKEALDEPESKSGGVHTYQVGPFPRVDVSLRDDVVESIVIYLAQPTSVDTVRNELKLERFKRAPVKDQSGVVLGEAYAERGIALTFAQTMKPRAVAQIMLEPVSAELFLLRARGIGDTQQQLADLRYARTLLDNDAKTYYLESQILQRHSRFHSAKLAMDKATEAGSTPKYELVRAKLQWHIGERDEALATVKRIAAEKEISDLTRAYAECALGDMLAKGKIRNYHGAFERHMKALTLVNQLVKSQDFATRTEAKRILIDAHLGVANDISWGDWRKKQEVIPKWTAIARKATENLIKRDGASERIRLSLIRRTLIAYSGLSADLHQEELAQEAVELGRKLIGATSDPLTKRAVQWELAETLYYASRCSQRRKQFPLAIQLGENAAALIETASKDVELTSSQRYLAGRVKFQVGSIHSLNRKAHGDALPWYEQVVKHFETIDHELMPATGSIGDRLVSMGVSYWQDGKREKAVLLTERGAELLQNAVNAGLRKGESLTIPYSNLASMHDVLGNQAEADRFSKKSEEYERETPNTARRGTSSRRR